MVTLSVEPVWRCDPIVPERLVIRAYLPAYCLRLVDERCIKAFDTCMSIDLVGPINFGSSLSSKR
jgi:hypothetical protein